MAKAGGLCFLNTLSKNTHESFNLYKNNWLSNAATDNATWPLGSFLFCITRCSSFSLVLKRASHPSHPTLTPYSHKKQSRLE